MTEAKDRARTKRANAYWARRAAGLCVNCTDPTDHRSLCRPCARYLNPLKKASEARKHGPRSRRNSCSTCGAVGHSKNICELNDPPSQQDTA